MGRSRRLNLQGTERGDRIPVDGCVGSELAGGQARSWERDGLGIRGEMGSAGSLTDGQARRSLQSFAAFELFLVYSGDRSNRGDCTAHPDKARAGAAQQRVLSLE